MVINFLSDISSFLIEGVGSFNKRIISAVLQIILYSSITIFLFSYYFGKPFLWGQWIAFIIGGALFVLGSFVTTFSVAKYIPPIIQRQHQDPTLSLYTYCVGLAFLMIFLIVSGLFGCVYLLGTETVVGFSLGAVLAGFFLRMGGSLFKTSADIGYDVLALSEKNILSFDARNPITILDIIGDVVGKVIGFGSDILMSLVFSISAMVLFSFALFRLALISVDEAHFLMALPFKIMVIGFISCVLAYVFAVVRIKQKKLQNVLLESVYIAVLLCGIGTWWILKTFELGVPMTVLWGTHGVFYPFGSYVMGLIGAVFFGFGSEYLTSYWYPPAKRLASTFELGTAVSILKGIASGLKSQVWFLFGMIVVLLSSFYFSGFLGIIMASLGMLSATGIILTVTFFSPLAANLVKIATLCEADESELKPIKVLDKLGHTTAALGNGFAVSTALCSTFGLFFIISLTAKMGLSALFFFDLKVFIGLLVGVSLPVIFSGFLLSGLISTIRLSILEVKRQFNEIPFLKEGKAKPDMTKASDAKSRAAMDALIIPGVIMVLVPIIIGFVFGIKVLAGIALGTLLMGFAKAFGDANSGGILHSAKQYLEKGYYGGNTSPNYDYAVIADNIGDAWKDLLSPSMTIFMRCVMIIVIHLILLLSL